MDDIYRRMFDASVRIEAAWPFPVHEPPDALAEAFEDQEGRLPQELTALMDHWSEDEKESLFSGDGRYFCDAFEELAAMGFKRRISGWVGVAATPVFRFHDDGNGASFSWGHYRTKMVFAPTADGLLERAAEWAEAGYEATRAQAIEAREGGDATAAPSQDESPVGAADAPKGEQP